MRVDRKHLAMIEKELRRSSDARGLLFANGVILVEGETELGALPVWYENDLGGRLKNLRSRFTRLAVTRASVHTSST